MIKRVQDLTPDRSAEAQAWVDENIADQERRYAEIVKEIDALEPERAKWYEEFLHIMATRGFNANGDQRVVIPKEKIPKKPNRPDKVIF